MCYKLWNFLSSQQVDETINEVPTLAYLKQGCLIDQNTKKGDDSVLPFIKLKTKLVKLSYLSINLSSKEMHAT